MRFYRICHPIYKVFFSWYRSPDSREPSMIFVVLTCTMMITVRDTLRQYGQETCRLAHRFSSLRPVFLIFTAACMAASTVLAELQLRVKKGGNIKLFLQILCKYSHGLHVTVYCKNFIRIFCFSFEIKILNKSRFALWLGSA